MVATSTPSPAATSVPGVPSPSDGPRGAPVADRGSVHHEELRASRWSAQGIVKVDRGVDVGTADLRGSVVVGGPLSAGELVVRGRLDARGPVVVERRFRLRGTLEAAAGVRAAELALDGSLAVAGELAAGAALRARGNLRAASVRSPTVELRGVAHVTGPVEGTTVEAVLGGDSALGEIRCRTLRLRGPVPNVVRQALGRPATVTVGTVEAESVYLEGVRVRFVRAREIVLGPAAHLGEYEGQLVRVHRSGRVGRESWTPPPPGLTR